MTTSTLNPTLPNGDLAAEDLRDLMRAVTDTTDRLQQTHTDLHGQVARLQAELADANAQLPRSRELAALGEMAAGIAHEVRNPLGSIQLYVQMVAEDLADRPQQEALCHKIGGAVRRLDAIVRDVLQFARDRTIRPVAVTPTQLLAEAAAACEAIVGSGAVQVRTRVSDDAPLRADPTLLVQALGNLVRNGIEAMRDHGVSQPCLTLGAERRVVRCPEGRRRPRVVLSVEDRGPGLPPEVVDRMFNPFFTTRATGTGLGLAIVHRIVDAHGGHVVVTNVPEPEGGGARIELCLPETPPDHDASEPPGDGVSSRAPALDTSPPPPPVIESSRKVSRA